MTVTRVEKLTYSAKSDGAIAYLHAEIDTDAKNFLRFHEKAVAATGATDEFKVTVSDEIATVEMITDFRTIDAARAVVEPYLRAWEITAFIQHYERHSDWQHPLLFNFVDAEVSNPAPLGAVGVVGNAAAGFYSKQYPPPPANFLATDEVQAMWARWLGYRANKEPLQMLVASS